MKFRQHIETSAPKVLDKSGQGFGTVAIHREIPRAVRDYTAKLGISSIEGEADASYCFTIVAEWVLLNRTVVAPADHTGRSNHLTHTLTAPLEEVDCWLSEQEKEGSPLWSPASLILHFEEKRRWRDSWVGDPLEMGREDFIEISELPDVSIHAPAVWRDDLAKGLAALDDKACLKRLKWNWEPSIKEACEQLRCYAAAFWAMDPDLGQGQNREWKEIADLFTQNLKNSWRWTFATVVLDSQRSDEFNWFGVAKGRTKGAKAQVEEFVPSEVVATSKNDRRANYVRDKNAVKNEMIMETFESSKQNVIGILGEWKKKLMNKVWPESKGDCLADEIVNCKIEISGLAEGIDKMSRDLEELERKMESTRTDLEKKQKNAKEWKDYASSLVALDESIRRPAGLDQAMQELEAASLAWKQSSTESIQNDHQELVQLSSQIRRNIQSLKAKMSSFYQSTSSPFRGKMHEPKEFQTALPRPSKSTSPNSLGPVREPAHGQASLLIGRQGQRVGLGQEQAHPVESAESKQLMEPLEYGSSTNLRRNAFSPKIAFITVTLLVLVGLIVWALVHDNKRGAQSSKSENQQALAQPTPTGSSSPGAGTSAPAGGTSSPAAGTSSPAAGTSSPAATSKVPANKPQAAATRTHQGSKITQPSSGASNGR